MLLIATPSKKALLRVVSSLLAGDISREEVRSWQRGVLQKCGWNLPISKSDGYWYFYSLRYVLAPFPPDYFLRNSDLLEYQRDMNGEPGGAILSNLSHLRSHQVNLNELRWPIAVITDHNDVMSRLPGTRGSFEKRMDMVEHCHMRYRKDNYLLVKQYDEQTGQVLLLGGNRDKPKAEELLSVLGITDYILP